MDESNDIAIIDYYHWKNGRPVVRIDSQRTDFLRELAKLFKQLATGEAAQFQMEPSEKVFFAKAIHGFTLRAVKHRSKRIRVKQTSKDQIDVCWEGTPGDWDNNLGLLEAMVECGVPCHQDFGRSSDDAEIEITLGERPAES